MSRLCQMACHRQQANLITYLSKISLKTVKQILFEVEVSLVQRGFDQNADDPIGREAARGLNLWHRHPTLYIGRAIDATTFAKYAQLVFRHACITHACITLRLISHIFFQKVIQNVLSIGNTGYIMMSNYQQGEIEPMDFDCLNLTYVIDVVANNENNTICNLKLPECDKI